MDAETDRDQWDEMATCRMGIPIEDLRRVLPPAQFDSLFDYLDGQTMALCDGWQYNYETNATEDSGCGPHGGVVYVRDVRRWAAGLPVDD